MARFLGVQVQTDILVTVPVGTAPRAVAFFRPDELISCTAVLSPTEAESLTVQVRRDDTRTAECVLGRVLRLCFAGGTDDTEWDILRADDASTDGVLTLTCTPILMRLARVVYMGTQATSGAPDPAYVGVERTATEWLNLLVIPALSSAGMAFALGTVDNTTSRFALDGEWASVLEIVNAIAAPGRANAEVRLRRDGGASYGYELDLVDSIGGTADTVRVRTAHNLIETQRERSLVELATRLYPRGASTSVATRTMSDHLWRIATVVSGTVLELEDAWGGDGPIGYDDQLNGMYLACLNSETFASTAVSDSVASTQRVTVGATAGMTAGDLVRFFAASGATGARVTSLTHPTLADHAADGGYGDRAQVLDRPAVVADTNMVQNATMATWSNAANPPDDWTEFAEVPASVTFSQELADSPEDSEFPAFRIVTTDDVMGEYTGDTMQKAVCVDSPPAAPWNDSWRRYTATVWIKVNDAPAGGVIEMYVHDGDRTDAELFRPANDAGVIGTWTEGTDEEDVWIRYESAALEMWSTVAVTPFPPVINGPVTVRVEIANTQAVDVGQTPGVWMGVYNAGTSYDIDDWVDYLGTAYRSLVGANIGTDPSAGAPNWSAPVGVTRTANAGWDVLVSAVTIAEATQPIEDREGSGGTQLWQEANIALETTANPIKGYDVTVADLAADDGITYDSLEFVPGGLVEVTDTELDVVTTLRLVSYERDYLRPLSSRIRVGQPADTFTRLVEAGLVTTAGRV